MRRGDREQRRDPQRPEVEPLEDDGAGRDRAGGREAEGADGVGELAGGVGRLALARVELAGQLEHVQTGRRRVRTRAAAGRAPRARAPASSPETALRIRMSPPRSTVEAGREADEGRDRGVGAGAAEERLLDRGVGVLERVVLPVEAAGALGDGGERRQQDRPEERVVVARAEARSGRARRSRRPARGGGRRSRCACPAAGAASAPAPRRSRGRAAGTRRSDGPPRVGCSSKANGSSAPRSAANAARQNARRDW